jgi:hypothetical protein
MWCSDCVCVRICVVYRTFICVCVLAQVNPPHTYIHTQTHVHLYCTSVCVDIQYAYVHTYVYICTTGICIYIYTCVCVCVCARVCLCMRVLKVGTEGYTQSSMYKYMCVRALVRVCLHVYLWRVMIVYIYIHVICKHRGKYTCKYLHVVSEYTPANIYTWSALLLCSIRGKADFIFLRMYIIDICICKFIHLLCTGLSVQVWRWEHEHT